MGPLSVFMLTVCARQLFLSKLRMGLLLSGGVVVLHFVVLLALIPVSATIAVP